MAMVNNSDDKRVADDEFDDFTVSDDDLSIFEKENSEKTKLQISPVSLNKSSRFMALSSTPNIPTKTLTTFLTLKTSLNPLMMKREWLL